MYYLSPAGPGVSALRSHARITSAADSAHDILWKRRHVSHSIRPHVPSWAHVLALWCHYWEAMIEEVGNYQDQMIVRSLFLHNLHRLKALYASKPFRNGFMLVDLAEGSKPQTKKSPLEARSMLWKLPLFKACDAANKQLINLVTIDRPSPN